MLQLFQNGILGPSIHFVTTGELVLKIILLSVIVAVVPYLLGSINSAVLVSRLIYGEDIRQKGSGNGGLTNMNRVYGKKAALYVLLGDMLKMVISLLFVGLFYGMLYGPYAFATNPLLYIAGTACVIGHIFPIYFKFKGGKGVLCTATMVLLLSPIVFLIEIVIFILLLVVTHYVSVSSMTVGLFYPFVLNRVMSAFGYVGTNGILILFPILIGLLIFYCHRSNIIRLKEHRENRFYFRKKDR